MDFRNEPETRDAPEPAILPQACGNVLLAVCRHSESMERLYSTLQPPEVDVSLLSVHCVIRK
jgi:hypothetical protein